MSSSTWQTHFKDQLANLAPPLEGSFLEHALLEGRLTEEDYLKWASQQHQLPVLDGRFFSERQPDPNLLRKISYAWSPLVFPVYEWDGVLYVACLEKPEDLTGPVCLLLAPRSGLITWWERLAGEANPAEAPEGVAISSEPAEEVLEGLGDSFSEPATLTGLSFAGITLAKPLASEPTAEPEPAPAPSVAPPAATSTIKPPPLVTSIASQASAKAKTPPATVTAPPPMKEAPQGLPAKSDAVATLTANAPSSDEGTAANFTVGLNDNPTPPAPTQLKTHVNPERTHGLSALVSKRPTFMAEVAESLRLLSGSFEKTMFLAADEKGETLVPLVWSESFGQPPLPGRISIGSPSMFRIVMTTEKAYHGHVVPNDINDYFAKIWNGGAVPEHATLVPFFFKNRVVGIMLGLGSKETFTLAILRHAEQTSATLTKKVGGRVEEAA